MENVTQMDGTQENVAPVMSHRHVFNTEFAYIASAVAAIQTYVLFVVMIPFFS